MFIIPIDIAVSNFTSIVRAIIGGGSIFDCFGHMRTFVDRAYTNNVGVCRIFDFIMPIDIPLSDFTFISGITRENFDFQINWCWSMIMRYSVVLLLLISS